MLIPLPWQMMSSYKRLHDQPLAQKRHKHCCLGWLSVSQVLIVSSTFGIWICLYVVFFLEHCYDCCVSVECRIRLGRIGRLAKGLRCLVAFHAMDVAGATVSAKKTKTTETKLHPYG